MKKKLVSMVLCTAMALSMITGCGESRQPAASAQPQEAAGTESDGSAAIGKYKYFLSVDVFDSQANYQGIQSGWFSKIVKD